MRRVLVILTLTGLVSLAACGGGSGGGGSGSTYSTPGAPAATTPVGVGNGITDPINRARSVVNQQNEQLRQSEQRTGQADPTIP